MRKHIWRKLRGGVWASGLPLVIGVFVVAAALALSYSPSIIPPAPAGAQGVGAALRGWGWSSNIGWISVNCLDTPNNCADSSFNLALGDINASGRRPITGFAWNEKIGWIRFDSVGPYPGVAADKTVQSAAYLNVADGRVLGFARACNVFASGCSGSLKGDTARGGWDGWISLGRTDSTAGTPALPAVATAQTNYGVQVVASPGTGGIVNLDFKYFAWGQTVIGWTNLAPMAGVGITCPDCDGPAPTVTLVSDDYEITPSQTITLTWTAQNADNGCTATAGTAEWLSPLAKNQNGGFEDVGDVTTDGRFQITCTNNAGSASAWVDIDVIGVDANNLIITKLGGGTGTVNSTDSKIACGTDCFEAYRLSPVATAVLNATAGTGSTFGIWGADAATCATTPSNCSLQMNTDKVAQVVFNRGPVDLTVAKTGTGDGTISTNIGGINCTPGCDSQSRYMPLNSVVTINVVPAGGSTFAGWGGNVPASCTTATLNCQVTMSQSRFVTARFDSGADALLAVSISGNRAGGVVSSVGGANDGFINCGFTPLTGMTPPCQHRYSNGTAVVLTANAGSNIGVTWSGCDSVTGTDGKVCNIAVDQDPTNITAAFNCTSGCGTPNPNLTVTKSGDGSGTVSSSPAGIDCGSDCSNSYSNGTVVTLEYTTSDDFIGWTGCGSTGDFDTDGKVDCRVTMSADKTVNANFDGTNGCSPNCPNILTVQINNSGSNGRVVSDPTGIINCPGICKKDGLNGTVTLEASPSVDFTSWSANCTPVSGQPTRCTVDLSSSNKTVTANFRGGPTVTLSADRTSVPVGGPTPVNLLWTVSGGSSPISCTAATAITGGASGPWAGSKSNVGGNENVGVTMSALGDKIKYTLTCIDNNNRIGSAFVEISAGGLPQCLNDLTLSGGNTILTQFTNDNSDDVVPNANLIVNLSTTMSSNVNVNLTSSPPPPESPFSNDPLNKVCIATGSAGKPNKDTCTISHGPVGVLAGSAKGRVLWSYSHNRGTAEVGVPSPYLGCNSLNGNLGCKVTITATPSGNSNCQADAKTIDMYLKFDDQTTAGKSRLP